MVSISAFHIFGFSEYEESRWPGFESRPAHSIKMEENKIKERKFVKFHDKHYKKLLLIPAIIILLSFVYLGVFYSQNHDFIKKDISLTGGTSITIYSPIPSAQILNDLSGQLEDLNVREIYDLVTREQEAVIVETSSDGDYSKQVLENYLGYTLTTDNSSFEFTGSSLSESFYNQLLLAVLIAFIFMGLVVFLLFRTFIPSIAVIISAFADILMTLVLVDVMGIKMSTAGIVAFLMLIGYSVDTDILLTNHILKRESEGSINRRILEAFKTGVTMTLTSLFAVLAALLVVSSFSIVLTQIFTILVIGLSFDLLNTWITNVSILKWYAQKKKK